MNECLFRLNYSKYIADYKDASTVIQTGINARYRNKYNNNLFQKEKILLCQTRLLAEEIKKASGGWWLVLDQEPEITLSGTYLENQPKN